MQAWSTHLYHPLERNLTDCLVWDMPTRSHHCLGAGKKIFRFLRMTMWRVGEGEFFLYLSGIAKKAIPFLVKKKKTVPPEAVTLGRIILCDVLEGKKLKSSVKQKGLDSVRKMDESIARGVEWRDRKKNGWPSVRWVNIAKRIKEIFSRLRVISCHGCARYGRARRRSRNAYRGECGFGHWNIPRVTRGGTIEAS